MEKSAVIGSLILFLLVIVISFSVKAPDDFIWGLICGGIVLFVGAIMGTVMDI